MPILQLALPTKSDLTPQPVPFLSTLHHVLPLFCDDACQQESSPPTLQGDPLTLGDFIPWQTPTLPMPQHVQLTLGKIATWRCWPTLSLVQPPHGNVALRSTPFLPTLQPMMPRTLPTLPTPFLRPNLLPSSMALQTKSNVVPWRILTPPTPQCVWPTLGIVACWPC